MTHIGSWLTWQQECRELRKLRCLDFVEHNHVESGQQTGPASSLDHLAPVNRVANCAYA